MNPVAARVVQTDRLATHLREGGDPAGIPVLFLHGAVTDSRSWAPVLRALPAGLRGVALDLRGFGQTESLPVDARLGLDDVAADVRSVISALKLGRHHVVAHGLGAVVAWRLIVRFFPDIRSCCVVSPLPPRGVGVGASGAAPLADPEEVRRLAAGDRTDVDPASPRRVLRRQAGGRVLPGEEDLVEAALTTVIDDDHYPGDPRPGATRGLLNALAPAWYRGEQALDVRQKPRLVWIRGESDTERFGAPGQDVAAEMAHFLGRYQQLGGQAREVHLPGLHHLPHLEDPGRFLSAWGEAALS